MSEQLLTFTGDVLAVPAVPPACGPPGTMCDTLVDSVCAVGSDDEADPKRSKRSGVGSDPLLEVTSPASPSPGQQAV